MKLPLTLFLLLTLGAALARAAPASSSPAERDQPDDDLWNPEKEEEPLRPRCSSVEEGEETPRHGDTDWIFERSYRYFYWLERTETAVTFFLMVLLAALVCLRMFAFARGPVETPRSTLSSTLEKEEREVRRLLSLTRGDKEKWRAILSEPELRVIVARLIKNKKEDKKGKISEF